MTSRPSASFDEFKEICSQAIKEFQSNRLLALISKGEFTLKDYHSFLLMIFHQTYMVPPTMGLAGGLCPEEKMLIKEYLIHHAEEEKGHWKWALSDLQSTGYKGPDPKQLLPSPACMQFISFSYFLAVRHPVARLGLPAVLEGISAQVAGNAAQKVQKILGLTKDQLIFAYGHGEADVGHVKDIYEVLEKSDLTQEDWKWLCYAAQITGKYYKNMFDEVASNASKT